VRTEACPICGGDTDAVLSLDFGPKYGLPTNIPLRQCASDNFLFVAAGDQVAYDDYYRAVANGHQEAEDGAALAVEQASVVSSLFDHYPRRVLDFGCGTGDLLIALASASPGARFFGCDMNGAAVAVAAERASGLSNVRFGSLDDARPLSPFDAIIMSHVIEHVVDFGQLAPVVDLLSEGGLLYVEVPNASDYEAYLRTEFLYYFDRLHVNHFTPQALAALFGALGLSLVDQARRSLQYRDGRPYPALGALFRKTGEPSEASSPDLRGSVSRYVASERKRCHPVRQRLAGLPGILVWGAGDNFHRSVANGGPLDGAKLMLLDQRRASVRVNGTAYETLPPEETIAQVPWPVAVTVSEHRAAIGKRIAEVDPARRIYLI
jgi:2-polyprenyl-3-methyl-5-hydroxy-6-metoxy-1,4-benzoquinol methylase